MKLNKESQIRPKKIYNQYINLVKKDLKLYDFKNHKISSCPFCKCKTSNLFFKKFDFNYLKCNFCESIYSFERPKLKDLSNYYKNSKSNSFWYEKFWPTVKDNRIKYIFSKRVNYIVKNKKKLNLKFSNYYDIGSGNSEFLNLFQKKIKRKVWGIEPSAKKYNKSDEVVIINSLFENTKLKNETASFVTAFELIEHILDPYNFIKKIFKFLRKNGTVIISFTDPTGFELNTLKHRSTQFFPPLHLNFMSIYSCYIILKEIGFRESKILSFGELDIDIVKNNYRFKKPNTILNSFMNIKDSQKFIKDYNLSSHKWLIARK